MLGMEMFGKGGTALLNSSVWLLPWLMVNYEWLRLQYDSDKTEVTFQRMARFQDDTSYDEIPGDFGVSLTSDGYWVYKEGSFLIRDWVVCERIEEDLGEYK